MVSYFLLVFYTSVTTNNPANELHIVKYKQASYKWKTVLCATDDELLVHLRTSVAVAAAELR